MKQKEPTYSDDPSSTSPHLGDYEGTTKKPKGNDYEVFLSFRGKDTRKGFTDYLYTSLVDAGIHVFRDDNELRVGEEIGSELLCSIMRSKISIPIISEDYASSKWCLRELVQMLKCKRSKGQVVLPIFYKVEPSQVQHLRERFGDAINAHKHSLDDMVVQEWEEALKEVSSLKGWESEKIDDGYEGALVKIVVRKVISELKRHFQLIVPKELVGIDNPVEEIMSFIDARFNDTRIIGIYGMGGIGKTTLARVLYNYLSSHFEHLSFVANIRETSLRKGIEWTQKQLIHDILRSSYDVSNVDEGIIIIKSRFTSKKSLILLDDMDDKAHLNALAGDGDWFKAGSIVIITTRNKSILDEARATYMYELNKLPLDSSLILFSRHAFRKDSPHSDYEVISRDIVSTTGGLPLALEVIGSFLREKKNKIWEDTLKKLKKVPDKKVQDTLRISYNSLDYETKQIFLDIACFCIGLSKQSVTYMWDACSFFPENGIELLSLMSLIKIDKDDKIMMHDQLRDLGREIVRLEHTKEPQERSRLWIHEEALDVIDNNKGSSKIEALCLGLSEFEALFLGDYYYKKSYRGEQFNELTNLRFLQLGEVNLIGDFQNLLPQLRWLQWKGCPLDFNMVNFHPKKLAVLDLSRSYISEDWGGWDPLKMATKLKVLNLSYCENLRRIPNLSTLKSLEILNLEYCLLLEEIHPSIWYIKTLVSLDVHGCFKLEKLPTRVGRMEELRELLYYDKLAQLPESMGSFKWLTKLDLSQTRIKELPEFIGSMKALETLNVSWCGLLDRIPNSIGNLASLSLLNLLGCQLLREIPNSIGKLTSLIKLQLTKTSITKLPESIGNLKNLRILELDETPMTELPSAIGILAKLQVLSASHCKNLEGLPSNIGNLVSLNEPHLDKLGILSLPESILEISSLQQLNVPNCKNLRELPESMGSLVSLTKLYLSHTRIKELPESIGFMRVLETLNASWCRSLDRIPNSIGNLESLSFLDLSGCHLLREIPNSIGKLTSLTKLQLAYTSFKRLPESIGDLQNLRIMDLQGALVIELPNAIGMLTKLQVLRALHCKNLEGLPNNIGELASLSKLHLGGSGILSLPESILKLSSLQYLDVRDCKKLREIPEPPSSLTALHIDFPTPSLPYLSKLTLLEELTLFDLRPLECLLELPIRLSMLLIKSSHLRYVERRDWGKAIAELIRDKSFGLRKVTRHLESLHFLRFQIDEAMSPDSRLNATIAKL